MEQGKTEGKNYGSQRLLGTKEAAEFLHISERTLWTITKSGDLTCKRLLGSVRYKMDDLVRYIDGLPSESMNKKKGAA